MARQRDYRAEYRARVERGKRLGLTTAQVTGHAKRGRVVLPSITELRQSGRYRYTPKRGKRPPPKVTDMAAGRLVNTSSEREVRSQLRAGAARGDRVALQLVIDKGDGRGPRTRVLDGRGDQRTIVGDGAGGERGEMGEGESGLGRADFIGKIQMVFGDAITTGGGFDPDELLDYFDAYDSIWDALGDLADSEYGG